MKVLFRTVCLAVALTTVGQVKADTINTFERGWYSHVGDHDPINDNYLVGSYDHYRNFFVFDLSGVPVSQTIISASLNIWNISGDSLFEAATYTIYDVSTDTPSLTGGGIGLKSIYDDLGTGISYGTQAITAADAEMFILVNFDTAGLSALNAARGGTFATGGRLSLRNSSSAFASTGTLNPNDGNTSLLFETAQTVPEPASIAIWGIGALGMCLFARSRKRPTA